MRCDQVLDEAIKSRVHLHLKYNALDKDQTVEIFKHNIKRLRVIEEQRSKDSRLAIAENDILEFARKHHDSHSNGSGIGMWNGRQIRNAFLIAASLAHYDGDEDQKSDPAMQKQLRASHFDLVEKATVSYDQDRAETLGHTDNELAYERMERNNARNRQGGHGEVVSGHPAARSNVQPRHYAGGPYVPPAGGFQTGQSAYPLQSQQQAYTAGSQGYGGQLSEPRFSSTINDSGFVGGGQHGFSSSNSDGSDIRGGSAPWQPQDNAQWKG